MFRGAAPCLVKVAQRIEHRLVEGSALPRPQLQSKVTGSNPVLGTLNKSREEVNL